MANETFQPGDIVQLKSGSPKMTVLWSNDGKTYCFWFDEHNHRFQDSDFHTILLQKYESVAIAF